jgi:hypothetical protein
MAEEVRRTAEIDRVWVQMTEDEQEACEAKAVLTTCPYCKSTGPFAISALREGRKLCVRCGEFCGEVLKEPEELKIVRNERPY